MTARPTPFDLDAALDAVGRSWGNAFAEPDALAAIHAHVDPALAIESAALAWRRWSLTVERNTRDGGPWGWRSDEADAARQIRDEAYTELVRLCDARPAARDPAMEAARER